MPKQMPIILFFVTLLIAATIFVLWAGRQISNRTDTAIAEYKAQFLDTASDMNQNLEGKDINGNVRCSPGHLYMAFKSVTVCIPYETPSNAPVH